jgi:hypothetical protein
MSLRSELESFNTFGKTTLVTETKGGKSPVPTFVNQFLTEKQREAHSIHEVSYRACVKPALPRFFVDRLTKPGELVYDPFMGRGTTLVEAALAGRRVAGCDVNPVSKILVEPRLAPPKLSAVKERLDRMATTLSKGAVPPDNLPDGELLPFFHPDTLATLRRLRADFLSRKLDDVDAWIRMVALNRLTGHSPGFFSGRTMPPNQAVRPDAQRKINEKLGQKPPKRAVFDIILKKSKALLSDLSAEDRAKLNASLPRLITSTSDATPEIRSGSVSLVVTSPPFLDVVNYADDNWLRCWFCGIDPSKVEITMAKTLPDWQWTMTGIFAELARVLRPGGHVAFEVGEVRGGKIKLEEAVIPCGGAVGLVAKLVVINAHEFTKTANCWGVSNNSKGTNTNRIVVFEKP